jgi:hypothetical protein
VNIFDRLNIFATKIGKKATSTSSTRAKKEALMSVDNSHGYDSEDEGTQKTDHERRCNHRAAMFLILPSLACCGLNVALFAVDMRFRLEHTSNRGYDRF